MPRRGVAGQRSPARHAGRHPTTRRGRRSSIHTTSRRDRSDRPDRPDHGPPKRKNGNEWAASRSTVARRLRPRSAARFSGLCPRPGGPLARPRPRIAPAFTPGRRPASLYPAARFSGLCPRPGGPLARPPPRIRPGVYAGAAAGAPPPPSFPLPPACWAGGKGKGGRGAAPSPVLKHWPNPGRGRRGGPAGTKPAEAGCGTPRDRRAHRRYRGGMVSGARRAVAPADASAGLCRPAFPCPARRQPIRRAEAAFSPCPRRAAWLPFCPVPPGRTKRRTETVWFPQPIPHDRRRMPDDT